MIGYNFGNKEWIIIDIDTIIQMQLYEEEFKWVQKLLDMER